MNNSTIEKTKCYRIGKGKPIYVINGGPGLEYQYLYNFMKIFSNSYEIIFYDQLATGSDYKLNANITSEDLVLQLHNLLISDKREKMIITHSWGSFLAISLYKNQVDYNIEKLVFVNPFALDYKRYLQSGNRLISRMPDSVLEKVEKLSLIGTPESYKEYMNLIAPYYTHDNKAEYDFNITSYNASIEDSIYASIADFNHVDLLKNINEDLYVIKTDDDFITLEDTEELQNKATKFFIIDDCGHFPFVEKPEVIKKILDEIFAT